MCVCVCVCPPRGDALSSLSSTQVLIEDQRRFLAFGFPCSCGRGVSEDRWQRFVSAEDGTLDEFEMT